MTQTRVAGQDFDLTPESVIAAIDGEAPEPIQEHYAVVAGRRFPPKQVLGLATGLDRADFTTHQARAILRRLGFGVYRRSAASKRTGAGPGADNGAAILEPFIGRWVAQVGGEVIFDADSPEAVLQWLRRYGHTARVWRIPDGPEEAGSALSAP
ncbi:MAG: hypothetical protein JO265_01170 [Acidimicrobiia bacterium]|nr:hypothetical protein [Acidimicrobiia bacterium]